MVTRLRCPTARERGGSGVFATILVRVEYGLGEATNKGVFLMTRQRHDDDDKGPERRVHYANDGCGDVLAPGETLRVPLFQMDAAVDDLQLSVMLDTIERERARRFGLRDAADLRKPGFRYNTSDAARDAREEARERYLDELENAWRAPPVGAGERGQIGQREGDTCTINGRRGVLIDVGGGADARPRSEHG